MQLSLLRQRNLLLVVNSDDGEDMTLHSRMQCMIGEIVNYPSVLGFIIMSTSTRGDSRMLFEFLRPFFSVLQLSSNAFVNGCKCFCLDR